MINWKQLDKWKQGLRATFPVVSAMRRRAAVDALEKNRNDPAVIPLLAEAVALRDTEAVNRARQALASLEAPKAIDALCAVWAKGRDDRLGEIIAECRYVASSPMQVSILSGLKCGKQFKIERPDVVPLFVSLLRDSDETIRTSAEESLKKVSPGKVRDVLCDVAIQAPKGRAAKLCLDCGFRPSDHERLCLFLFVTTTAGTRKRGDPRPVQPERGTDCDQHRWHRACLEHEFGRVRSRSTATSQVGALDHVQPQRKPSDHGMSRRYGACSGFEHRPVRISTSSGLLTFGKETRTGTDDFRMWTVQDRTAIQLLHRRSPSGLRGRHLRLQSGESQAAKLSDVAMPKPPPVPKKPKRIFDV